eukprot:2048798-Pleurochrysis_carterae.AAC.1
MLAATEVTEPKRVITFGFDETTKFQVGTLSTNVQGGHCYAWRLLHSWRQSASPMPQAAAALPALWTGPQPDALALERLQGRSL